MSIHSRHYDNGAIWAACSECNRGGNGSAEHKCVAGGLIKVWDKLGCFSGTIPKEKLAELQQTPLLFWDKPNLVGVGNE